MHLPLFWLWKLRYWAWIVGAATASPLPPIATLLFLGLVVHVGYDLATGGQPPRALLPVAEPGRRRHQVERARESLTLPVAPAAPRMETQSSAAPVAARVASVDTTPRQRPAAPAPAALALHDLAGVENVWVVGPKGSGKTTVLRALLALRRGERVALDPHNAPDKWPCQVVGGGRRYGAISAALTHHVELMSRRYEAMDRGELTEAECRAHPHTLVGDEWMSVAEALPGKAATRGEEAEPGASTRLFELLTEGRKAGVWVLAASHADTATAMGLLGKKDVLLCFDRVVYLGALAVARHPAAANLARPAVVLDPERGSWQLLDVSEAPALARTAPTVAEALAEPAPLDLLAELLAQPQPPLPGLRPLTDDEQQRLVWARRIAPRLGKTEAIMVAFERPSGPKYQRYAADPSWRS